MHLFISTSLLHHAVASSALLVNDKVRVALVTSFISLVKVACGNSIRKKKREKTFGFE